jgi:signal transduction histidine kinase
MDVESVRLLRFASTAAQAADYRGLLAALRKEFGDEIGACALLEVSGRELVVVGTDETSKLKMGERRRCPEELRTGEILSGTVHGDAENLLPLFSAGELIGALAVSRPRRPVFADERALLLGLAIAAHLALVVAGVRASLLRRRCANMLMHDFRAPIGVLSMNLETLRAVLEETSPSADALDAICDCQRSLKQLTGMTADLYDISRAEEHGITVKRERANARALLERVVDGVRPLAPRMRFAVSADRAVTLDCDVTLVSRVFDNIVSNAIRYADDGSEIRLEAVVDAKAARVVFGIENDGRPLDPNEGALLFEKYGEGHGRAGRGIGLYFCRLVVEAHGGTIAVRAPAKRGTRFEVALPLRSEDAA